MQIINNATILILRPSDIVERFQYNFDKTNLIHKEFIKYFNFKSKELALRASLVLFIEDNGNTTIIKNRYGNGQI